MLWLKNIFVIERDCQCAVIFDYLSLIFVMCACINLCVEQPYGDAHFLREYKLVNSQRARCSRSSFEIVVFFWNRAWQLSSNAAR